MKQCKMKKINLIIVFVFLCICFAFASAKIVDSATIINISNKFKYITKTTFEANGYRIGQSFCKVGNYYVCAIIDATDQNNTNTLLSVVNAKTGKVENKITCFNFEHANGMTYNPDNGNIYIAHWSSNLNKKNVVSYFPASLITSTDSAKIRSSIKTITLPYKVSSIEYDSYHKRYITNANKKVCIYDKNFNFISSFEKEQTNQDICVYKGLILAAEYDNTEKYGSTIYMYSSDGTYQGVLGMTNTNKIDGKKVMTNSKKVEIESIDELSDNKVAVFFYTNAEEYGNPIFSLSFDFNKYIRGAVEYKVSGLNENNLENISFSIYADSNSNGKLDSEDEKIKDVLSDNTGTFKVSGLKYGDYIAKLNTNITGYETTKEETTFSISYDGEIVEKEIKFMPKTYIINYNGNSATSGVMTPSTFEYDKEYVLKANAYSRKNKITYDLTNYGGNIKTAYVEANFEGWSKDKNSTVAEYLPNQKVKNIADSGRVELYAVWKLKSAVLIKPQKEGYTCIGWSKNPNNTFVEYKCGQEVVVEEDITLYPIFVGNDYIVEYNGNGSTAGSMGTGLFVVGRYESLEENKFVKRNTLTLNYNYGEYQTETKELEASFMYWNTKADNTGEKYSNKEKVKDIIDNTNRKMTLYAQWKLPEVVLPKLTREGFECIGWNTYEFATESLYNCGETYKIGADVELFAVWKSKTYQVRYNGNGSTAGITLNSSHELGKESNLNKNNYRKEHTVKIVIDGNEKVLNTVSSFKCWNTKPDGIGTSYSDSESILNLTNIADETVNLYAIWRDEEIVLSTPEKKKYECVGWSTDKNSKNPEYKCGEKLSISKNITLYAIFEKVESKYSLNVNLNLIDSESKTKLNGAEYKIYEFDKEKNAYIEYATMNNNSDGKYTSNMILEYTAENQGEFKVVQTLAPIGYYGDFENDTKKEYKFNIASIIENGKYNDQEVKNKGEITLKNNGRDFENERVKGNIILNISTEGDIGDASLIGSKWGLYKDGNLISAKTLDKDKITFTSLGLGEYTVKEIETSLGFISDEKEYKIILNYIDENTKNVCEDIDIVKTAKKQSVHIINENSEIENTEKNVFKAYLISDLSDIEERKIRESSDEYNIYNFEGYEFSTKTEKNISTLISYNTYEIKNLAYGRYVIVNENSENNIKPFVINITENSTTPQIWKLNSEEKQIKISLVDKSTNEKILKPNATYVIYNLDKCEYVEQEMYGIEGVKVGSLKMPFVTDEKGEFITPQGLESGRYRLKELSAPEGYILPGYNKTIINGEYVNDSKNSMEIEIAANIPYRVENKYSNVISLIDYNMAAKGEINYSVTKESLNNIDTENYGDYKFEYGENKLEKINISLYAKENILKASDGKTIKYQKDELIENYYTTGNTLNLKGIDCGKYYIKVNYIANEKPENEIIADVDISYENDTVALVSKNVNSKIERTKNTVSIKNINEKDEAIQNSVFGIYNLENISYMSEENVERNLIANQLLAKVSTNEYGEADFNNLDLPTGNYYIKQLESKAGYTKNSEKVKIDLVNNYSVYKEFKNEFIKLKIQVIDSDTEKGIRDTKLRITNNNGLDIEHTTDQNGYIMIQGLTAGEKIVIEESSIKEGYSKNIINVSGKELEITNQDKNSVEILLKDTEEVQVLELKNQVQVINLELISKGEVFTGKFEDGKAVYKSVNLENSKFNIYANKDIKYPDEEETIIVKKGTKIATATTKENGSVEIVKVNYESIKNVDEKIQKVLERGIPAGEYKIVNEEIKNGFYNNENKEIIIELETNQSDDTIAKKQVTINSSRQKVNITVNNKTNSGEIIKGSKFGIYTNSEIMYLDENNNVQTIAKNKLIKIVDTNENGEAVFTSLDLPLGKYYIKQEVAPEGYKENDGKLILDLSHQESNLENIFVLKTFINEKIEVEVKKENSEVKSIVKTNEISEEIVRKTTIEETKESEEKQVVVPSISDVKVERQTQIEETSENYQYYIENMNSADTSIKNFDLSVETYISEIRNKNNGNETKLYTGFTNATSEVAKTDIKADKLEESEIIIKYIVRISNNGDCDGYIGKIVDYMPQSLTFEAKDNIGWIQTSTVRLENSSLYGETIKPGEVKEIELYLRWNNEREKLGKITNEVEIIDLNNEYDLKEINTENNKSSSVVIISIKTNFENNAIYLSIIGLSLCVIGGGILAIKRFML